MTGKGWFNESNPHALAARGVKLGRTKRKSNIRLSKAPEAPSENSKARELKIAEETKASIKDLYPEVAKGASMDSEYNFEEDIVGSVQDSWADREAIPTKKEIAKAIKDVAGFEDYY